MEAIGKSRPCARRAVKPEREISRADLLAAIAMLLFAGGFTLPVVGLALIVTHSLIPGDLLFGRIGTALMIATIPVLLAGSHLMDLTDSRNYDK